MGMAFGFAPFNTPEVAAGLDALKKAGEKSMEIARYAASYTLKAKEAGFPMQYGGFTQAPFDTLGDYFRGTKGLMLDMYRRPKEVIRACEKLLPIMVDMALGASRVSGNPRIFIPIHKGLDGFMSMEQFHTFFWPTLKDLMVALIMRASFRARCGRATAPRVFPPSGRYRRAGPGTPLRRRTSSGQRRYWATRSASRATCPFR